MRWGRVVVFAVVIIVLLALGVGLVNHHPSAPAPAAVTTVPSLPTAMPTPRSFVPAALPAIPAPLPKPIPVMPKIKKPASPHVVPKPVAPTPTVPVVPYHPPVVVIPPEPVAQTEWKGVDTQIKHPGQVVVHSDEQWIHFWTEHHPHEASPDVDFGRYMVVGVFAGSRPADAFSIDIVAVRPQADAIIIDYKEYTPPTGTFAMGVEIFPYHLKAIPRSNLPVKFNKLQPTQK